MTRLKVELDVGKPIDFFGLWMLATQKDASITGTLGTVTLSKMYDPSGKDVGFRSVQIAPKDGMSSIRAFVKDDTHPLLITIDHQRGSGKVDCNSALKGYVAEFDIPTFNTNRQMVPSGILG